MGAFGSTGCVIAAFLTFFAWTSRAQLMGLTFAALCVGIVIVGGASLAAVLRATDRVTLGLTHSGEIVGRRARRILRIMSRLAREAAHSPSGLRPHRLAALRRLLVAARDPEVESWISDDVRGRAELLMARASAAAGGPAWAYDAARRDEVRALLMAAAKHLADPSAAEADLAALDQPIATAPMLSRVAPRTPGVRLALDAPQGHELAEGDELTDDEPLGAVRTSRARTISRR